MRIGFNYGATFQGFRDNCHKSDRLVSQYVTDSSLIAIPLMFSSHWDRRNPVSDEYRTDQWAILPYLCKGSTKLTALIKGTNMHPNGHMGQNFAN